MNIIGKIVNKCDVYIVCYQSADKYNIEQWSVSLKRKIVTEKLLDTSYNAKRPAIVLLSGYGVITKAVADSADTIGRVTSSEEYICTTSTKDKISFTKREKILPVLDIFAEKGLKIVGIECVDNDVESIGSIVEESVVRVYGERLNFKGLFQDNEYAPIVAKLTFDKIKLPILTVILIVLVANTVISKNISGEYSVRKASLTALQNKMGDTNHSSAKKRNMVSEYTQNLPHSYAYICDQVGMCVPKGMILTQIAIQPPIKRIEEGKKPILSKNSVQIMGEAKSSSTISEFVSNLTSASFGREVLLSSVGKSQNGNNSLFLITIKL